MRKLIIGALAVIAAVGAFSMDIGHRGGDWVTYDAWKIGVNEAAARRGFSSRSFSSRSFSSRSSSRSSRSLWNRPSRRTTPTVRTPRRTPPTATRTTTRKTTTTSGGYGSKAKKTGTSKSGGYAKKGTKPTVSAKKKFTPNATGKAVQRKVASKSVKRHRAETSKFAKGRSPSTLKSASTYRSNPIAARARTRPITHTTYYNNRNAHYVRIGYTPGIWVGRSYSSFGMYDSMFMWSMLANANSRMYYHHRRDAGFREWRREADRMARDNADLRRQLASLDAKVTNVSGPVDPNYMPEGVDPSVALAADVVASATGALEVTMGTGGTAGNYFAFCNSIRRHAAAGGLKVTCKNTNGSLGNLQGLTAGNFGAIMVQSDVLNEYLRQNPGVKIDALQSDVYKEVVYLIVNKRSGIDSIKDLKPRKHRLYYAGSGATKTMQGFARQDRSYVAMYKSGTQVNADVATLRMVANNPNGAMLFVCGLKCDLIQKANDMFGDQLQMAEVDDGDFNDAKDQFGSRIYDFVEVPRIYTNLMPSSWIGSGSIETLAVNAIFVLSKEWAEEKGMKGLSALEAALWPAMKEIRTKVGAPE